MLFMKKILIIVSDKKKYFWKYVDIQDVEICEIYRREFRFKWLDKLKKKDRKWNYHRLGILSKEIFDLQKYDMIIFFDSAYTKQVDFLLKLYKGKIVFFYWNKMQSDYIMAERQNGAIYEKAQIYSYSRHDCKRHDIRFNSTMYYPCNGIGFSHRKVYQYDILFVGCVVGWRTKQLDKILQIMEQQKITCYVHACKSGKIDDQDVVAQHYILQSKFIAYEEYLCYLSKSRAILDIDKCDGVGCSLRAMEAIFYHKKYITNNVYIVNENFYDKRNIFILGVDEIGKLKEFIESPYAELPQEIVDYYRIENWIKRFNEEQNEQ